jgi:hypothetical protein
LRGAIETKQFRDSCEPPRGGIADKIASAIAWLLSDEAPHVAGMKTNISCGCKARHKD